MPSIRPRRSWAASCPPRAPPHLLLEAPVVHLVHAAAGEGLQVLPALAAEEPHVAQPRREVAQELLEIGRVLQGGSKHRGCRGAGARRLHPSNPSKARAPLPDALAAASSPGGVLGARPGGRTRRAAAPPTAPRRSCTPWKAKGRGWRDPR